MPNQSSLSLPSHSALRHRSANHSVGPFLFSFFSPSFSFFLLLSLSFFFLIHPPFIICILSLLLFICIFSIILFWLIDWWTTESVFFLIYLLPFCGDCSLHFVPLPGYTNQSVRLIVAGARSVGQFRCTVYMHTNTHTHTNWHTQTLLRPNLQLLWSLNPFKCLPFSPTSTLADRLSSGSLLSLLMAFSFPFAFPSVTNCTNRLQHLFILWWLLF